MLSLEQTPYCNMLSQKYEGSSYLQESEKEEVIKKKGQKPQKRNKRQRQILYKRKLEEMAKNNTGAYLKEYQYVRGGTFIPVEKPYLKRIYRGRGHGKSYFVKLYSNRKVRHYKSVRKAHSFRGGMDSTFIL